MEMPTNMHLLILLAACVLFTTTECATRIENCPSGSVDVEQNTTGVLVCVGYSASPITWEFKSGQSSFSTIGRCYSSSPCTLEGTYTGIFAVDANSGTSSNLTLTMTFTEGLKNATFACDGVECLVDIVPPLTTTTTTTTTTETVTEELSDAEIAGIAIGCILFGAIIVVVIVVIWFKKKKKFCFETNGSDKPSNTTGSEMTGNGRGNATSSDKPVTSPAVPADGRRRELPQPKRRQGATVTPNETPGVVDNASPSPRPRELPHPRITEHNMTTSVPPQSLPPLRTQATTSLTSVERNSFAEKPLPSIPPMETQ